MRKFKYFIWFVIIASCNYKCKSPIGQKVEVKYTSQLDEFVKASTLAGQQTSFRKIITNDYTLPITSSTFYSQNSEANKYIYSFYPDYPLILGRGIDPNKLQETKFSPLAEIVKDTVDGKKPLSTTAEVFLVSNKDELRKVFDLDVKMSVRYLGYSGSSSLNIINTYDFEQNNVMVVIKGQSEFSRIGLKNLKLSEEAKKILSQAGGYNEFVRLYGSNFVSMERRGVSVYLFITINNVSSTTKNSMNASLEASGGFGPVSGKLEMKLRQELYQKSQKEDLNIRFVSYGGEGLADFSSIISKLKTSGNTFDEIKEELSKTLKNYGTIDKSVPIGYLVTPISNIPNVYTSKIEDNFSAVQEKYLGAVSEKYSSNFEKLNVFESIINQTHPLSWYTNDLDINNISNGIPVQKEYVERLKSLHDTLLNHFDFFKGKPESKIEDRLIYISPVGKPLLDAANKVLESKYFTINSTNERYEFSGFGIKGINFYLQGELSDYTKSEGTGNEYEKSFQIFEIIPMANIGGQIIPSEIMGTLTSFSIDKKLLNSNLESGALGLKVGNTAFSQDSKKFKYFSVTCIITSVFGKQVRIPIGYLLYNDSKDSYQSYIRPELSFRSAIFINH